MSYWTDVTGLIKGSIQNKASIKTLLEEVFDGYDLGKPNLPQDKDKDIVYIDFSFDGSDEEAVGRLLVFTSKLKQHKLTYDLSITTRFHNWF